MKIKKCRKNTINTYKSLQEKIIISIFVVAMVISGMFIQGKSDVLSANDEAMKAISSFPDVSIDKGSEIYLNNKISSYVGDDTLISEYNSGLVSGDATGMVDGANYVWNAHYAGDKAVNLGILKQKDIPSVQNITDWKSYIDPMGNPYWLSDTKTVDIDDGSGLTTTTGKKLLLETRAVFDRNNNALNNDLTISGKYATTGAEFDGKKVSLGSYQSAGKEDIVLNDLVRKQGWYKDLFSHLPAEEDGTFFNKYRFADSSYDPGKPLGPDNYGGFYKPGNSAYDSLPDVAKQQTMNLYKTPECKESDRVYIDYFDNHANTGIKSLYLYNDSNGSFEAPVNGRIYPEGTKLVYFYFEKKIIIDKAGADGKIYRTYTGSLFKDGTDVSDIEKISGEIVRGTGTEPSTWKYIDPLLSNLPESFENKVYLLYGTTPKDLKATMEPGVNAVEVFYRAINGGLRYYETDTTIKGTKIPAGQNRVRPTMTLDTKAIKFARPHTSSTITSEATLGDMPTTNLLKDNKYKLVLNNDALKVNPITKGTVGVAAKNNTVAADMDTSKATISEDNVISVTPGTTEITIPVSTHGGNKVSAVSTKMDGTTATYGVVGDIGTTESNKGSITINIADLMDTSKVTSVSGGQGKTITLFNEQLNAAGCSDEISQEGLALTIKVENSQEIDFTADTKDTVLKQTYVYGDTFTVEAEVTKKGNGEVADTVTPITFITSTEHLEMQGTASWDETALKGTAIFKVVKPYTGSDGLKIAINKAGSTTHDPAPEMKSTDIATEKRKIDLKINPDLLVADKGKDRLSLKGGGTMPDIAERYIAYKPGTETVDLVAKEDKEHVDGNKIPYTLKTTHWLGD